MPDPVEPATAPHVQPERRERAHVFGDLSGLVPPLTVGQYDVPVRLLPTPAGQPLLLPTAREVEARYARYRARLKEDLAGQDEGVRAAAMEAAAAAESQEAEALAGIEREFAGRIETHTFRFRTATNADVMEAETDALAAPARAASSTAREPGGPGQPAPQPRPLDVQPRPLDVRLRPEFCYALAARTFVGTTWDGPGTTPTDDALHFLQRVLPNAVSEHVVTEVRARIDFATDMVSFWATWGKSSSGA